MKEKWIEEETEIKTLAVEMTEKVPISNHKKRS
jgi:hypothetical protein